MTDEELKAVIGQNVAQYRTQAGLTQEQLSERIGVSTAFISQLERGQKMMRLPTLRTVARSLNVSCDALLYPPGPEASIDNILYLLSQQSPKVLARIEKMIRALLEDADAAESPAPPSQQR